MSDSLIIIDGGSTMVQRRYQNGSSRPCNGALWTSLWKRAATLADRIADGDGDVLDRPFSHQIIRLHLEDCTFIHWQQKSGDHNVNRTLHIEFPDTALAAKFDLDCSCAVVGGYEDDHRRDIQMMARLGYIAMAALCNEDGLACADRADADLATMCLATHAQAINQHIPVASITHRTPLNPAFFTDARISTSFDSSDIAMAMTAKLLGHLSANGDEHPARLSLAPLKVDRPQAFSSPVEVLRAIAASGRDPEVTRATHWSL